MERIQALKNSIKNRKGFTLVEIAIVLVIIGIILGAALKGKDLIYGARYKKFINQGPLAWTTTAFHYMDRMGQFPGDLDKNGLIGDGDVLANLNAANLVDRPSVSPYNIGGFNFYFFLGDDGNATVKKNILIVCNKADCTTAFDNEEIKYIQAFDTSIDGTVDGTAGLGRCVTAAATIGAVAATETGTSTAPVVSAACAGATTQAMIYYFDRKP